MNRMRRSTIIAFACLLAFPACGMGSESQTLRGSSNTQTITMFPPGSYTHKVGKREVDDGKIGDWSEVVGQRVDCGETHENDVLLVWGETTVRFPGIWPAGGPLIFSGDFENPPVLIRFPAPLNSQGDAAKEVLWSSEKLIVDGAPYELVAGENYVFTGDGLEAASGTSVDPD